ncbi:UDP:flavonoid glycosyltransferase YjiC (YdhE family) [Streptomyces africanus]|uniref:UDP:flavonoid glycosyltransferase YjiC (YdhE family) n=1 Tax=Streptomyces africanus TaxID=231024 RepID=A0ABU0QNK3_9ACTN|nr:glycosyltransferase [Streptomyces africanus]MDQ0748555.1 UDP:flavonoid glycosyltransferase YjiC (YdhE family) [Streptomyces africanus]
MGRTVVIFAAGSRGDVQPCLALGRALARRGDTVRVLASRRYEHLIAEEGLDFHPLPADPVQIIESVEGQELLEGPRNPAAFVRRMDRVLRPHIMPMLEETRAGAKGADLVLAPTLGFLGVHLSQYLRVPHAVIHFQPSQPTKAFPHPLAPTAGMLGALGNRLSFGAVDLGSWMLCRSFVNTWRRESLGLSELSLSAPFRHVRRAPVLCAFSPTVVPRPSDWKPNVHVTGFWHHDQPTWEPPRRLLDFLADGPPPVYVGFGSMKTRDPEATDTFVRTALRREKLRGVLSGDPATSEDDILVVGDTPHDWLFPRMAAVVHHGGAGTTASALRAGRPSLVCPFFGDQPYWAARVRELGAGPAPLPARELTVSALAHSLHELTRHPPFAEAARRLGRALEAENGTARACEVLDEYLVGSPSWLKRV